MSSYTPHARLKGTRSNVIIFRTIQLINYVEEEWTIYKNKVVKVLGKERADVEISSRGGHAKSHHESENYLLYVPSCAGYYYEEHFVGMEVLGEGSFGVVFKAVNLEDNCAYAMKISARTHVHTRTGSSK